MHLLILGASGRTGVYGCNYALEQGHRVTAIVRDAKAIKPHTNLTVIEGSIESKEVIDNAFRTTSGPIDAALEFLNPSKESAPRLLADVTSKIAYKLRHQHHKPEIKPRLVVMSAVGVGESRKVAPFLAKFLIDHHGDTSRIYKDHEAVNAEIEENCGVDLQWTLVMAVGLGTAGLKPVKAFGPTESGADWYVSRESVARWMIDVAVGRMADRFSNQRVIVSN